MMIVKSKKLLILVSFLLVIQLLNAESESESYYPSIDGTIRGKYEYFSELNQHRFQVRNARFSLRGKVTPITWYKAEIDLSDEGRTRMLDAFVQFKPEKWWSFSIGQQKVPFSTDNLRSPHNFWFANRSFIGKQLTNLRDVGVSFNIINKKFLPIDFTLGVYNGMGLYTQDKTLDLNELSYAGRIVFQPFSSLQLQLNALTIHPCQIRMNYYSPGLMFNFSNFTFEMEYLYKTYKSVSKLDFNETQSWLIQANYDIYTPKFKYVKKVTPLLRYDDMKKNMRYDVQSSSSIIVKTDEARKRLTGGITLSFAKPFVNEIRLNYERYYWPDGKATDSKLVAEFMVHF
jgi:hypothetical protein